jgi:CRISPR-associated protein Cas5d
MIGTAATQEDNMNTNTYRVKIQGPLACFTNPIFKVERVSYNVITPSAVRGCLDAVLWHPGVTWHVSRVEIHAPIKKIQLMRNEVKDVASKERPHIDITASRTQRHMLALRDVCYVVEVALRYDHDLGCRLSGRRDYRGSHGKFTEMFERRLAAGQHFHHPYLGCREFAADVRFDDKTTTAIDLDFTELMIYDPVQDERNVFIADVRNGAYEVDERFALVGGGCHGLDDEAPVEEVRAKTKRKRGKTKV